MDINLPIRQVSNAIENAISGSIPIKMLLQTQIRKEQPNLFQSHQQNGIRGHIQRKLINRLCVSAVIISTLLSLAVFFNERDKLSQQLIFETRQVAKRFNAQIGSMIDTSGEGDEVNVQDRLNILFIAAKRLQAAGHFVFIGIYDLSGDTLAFVRDESYPKISKVQQMMEERRRRSQVSHTPISRIRHVERSPHIYLTYPLTNQNNQVSAYATAVFALSSKTIKSVEARLLKTVLTVITIVLLTTALLYPLIALLMNRLTGLATNLLDANLETLRVLGSAIAKRDSETEGHNYRVTIYAVRLAEAIHLDTNSIRKLIKGAFLHDVGKIGISDRILLKPGELTQTEFNKMKQHVQHGLDIIETSDWLLDAADVVGCHHEQYCGGGYPFGLKGEQIPLNARIFAIADVFDALTSKRPYKMPFSLKKTLRVLKGMNEVNFDPRLLRSFINIVDKLYLEIALGDDKTSLKELELIVQEYFKKLQLQT